MVGIKDVFMKMDTSFCFGEIVCGWTGKEVPLV